MLSRRKFLGTAASAAMMAGVPPSLRRLSDPGRDSRISFPGEGRADDESFWTAVQQSFTVDRSIIHLNNGGVCPAPLSVQQSQIAHLQEAHRSPFYAHRGMVAPQIESVRRQLADCLYCDADEVAFTRNTSEGMEIVQLGIDLKPGDEVLTTTQDYPRMVQTWHQRARRDGIVLKVVDIPVPLLDGAELVDRFRRAMTTRTRLIMCCHMIDLTGQILPVRKICDLAHEEDIPVLVDGAQTLGHIQFRIDELGCDFFATSLHKWMMGPQGTGLLYVRKSKIDTVWSLMSSDPAQSDDIRKFEDIGTTPQARLLGLGEAVAFHHQIGIARKQARLVYLRNYWLNRLTRFDRVRVLTNTQHAGSLTTIEIDGIDPLELRNYLWNHHRIRVRPIRHDAVWGIRVSAGVYTTLTELDRFVDIMAGIIRYGIPATA